MLRSLKAAAAAAFALTSVSAAEAATVIATFSNVNGAINGTVSVEFEVSDADGVNAATAATLIAFPSAALGYGTIGDDLFTDWLGVSNNDFAFSGGEVTDALFIAYFDPNTALVIDTFGVFGPASFANLQGTANATTGVLDDGTTLEFTTPSEVPLPAAAPLLLLGLGGLAALRRRAA